MNLSFIKIKNHCASENIITKGKGPLTEGEKMFAHHISDKRLVCRAYKEALGCNFKKIINLI